MEGINRTDAWRQPLLQSDRSSRIGAMIKQQYRGRRVFRTPTIWVSLNFDLRRAAVRSAAAYLKGSPTRTSAKVQERTQKQGYVGERVAIDGPPLGGVRISGAKGSISLSLYTVP